MASILAGLGAAHALADGGYQPVQGPHTLNPGEWPQHYPFADETEAAVAASEVHHVRYIDSHVRLVEVAYFPGVIGNMHGHPFPSVFAVDAPVPKGTNTLFMDHDHNMQMALSAPPDGATYPYCRVASPQILHHETNLDTFPHHFYRLEFLRVDGAALKDRWKDWYTHPMTTPTRDRLLFENDHIRLKEVLVLPGQTQRTDASSNPVVIAYDVAGMPIPKPKGGHQSPVLKGFEQINCATSGARPGAVVRNTSDTPIHYYSIEFKRIDGDGIKDHWREWYPWMVTLKDAYDHSPNVPNF
ncbi:MAG TPA: hypothetical protein VMU59_04175 [Caulobacteraceae bacterium]|nr:hypothetical protein [Caulobacteraceae bacterium]